MITDLVQIRRLGESKRDENSRLRLHLKRHNYVERRLKKIAEDIQGQIDCTVCANCCRVATTPISERDIDKITRFLSIDRVQFLKDYTDLDESGVKILKRNAAGCVFLNGNECSIYDMRPRTCELFPHVVKGQGPIATRMWDLIDRATYCPIVYNSLEAFKKEVGFQT